MVLPPDEPHDTSHCGTCTRCLDECPTDAFVGPWQLDARRCISYLTIELRDEPVPRSLRPGMGEWLFGCDVCQDVCPWNRKARRSSDVVFEPAADLNPVDLIRLLDLNEEQFRERFGKTPLARPGRSGLLRNACLLLGVQRHEPAVPSLIRMLDDAEPLIRGAAAWALGRIGTVAVCDALQSRSAVEEHAGVREELEQALRSMERAAPRDT